MPLSLPIELDGEQILLRGDKTAFWAAETTLFVADAHLGKAASFRAGGIPVPQGTTAGVLGGLSTALRETGAQKLVFLGDLWHAAAGRTEETKASFATWRKQHADVEMTLVQGNHDARSGRLERRWDVREVEEGSPLGPFSLCHYPQDRADGYVLAGHIHPAAILEGRGGQALALPCYWVRPQMMVLPAFGEFTGCGRILPNPSDRVYLVAEAQVIPAQ